MATVFALLTASACVVQDFEDRIARLSALAALLIRVQVTEPVVISARVRVRGGTLVKLVNSRVPSCMVSPVGAPLIIIRAAEANVMITGNARVTLVMRDLIAPFCVSGG